jgi:hypothetical protein
MKFFTKLVIFTLMGIFFSIMLLNIIIPVPESVIKSLSAGVFIALLFVSTGFMSFLIARKLEQKGFNLLVVVTSIFRMLLLLMTVVLLVKFTYYDAKIITVSLLCSYFIFQIIEIIGFAKINPKES